jgi:hypothetical protein
MRSVGIMAYGTPEDRAKINALAKKRDVSASQIIVELIREEYEKTFGKLPTDHQS